MSVVNADNKPSWTTMLWRKCKEQPIVPVGAGATVVALLGATYYLRKGNRDRFNQFLRLRIYAQGATVIALMVYGSVAFTGQQQQAAYIKSQIKMGDFPKNTQYPGRKDVPEDESQLPVDHELRPTALPESLSAVVDAPPTEKQKARGYPLRKDERMKISEFAARLRKAEELQQEEEDAKAAAGK
ncbi:hypothetical protein IAT38_007503 [Cryptococcus sp. DSM 104549]